MGRKSLKTDRRKEIVKAFYAVAKKEGLENTSLSKIAKKLKMPPSLLVHYFSTKEELLLELIDFIISNYKSIYIPKEDLKSSSFKKLLLVMDNIFSRKWNRLIDDGVFYSCFALVFQDKRIKAKFYELHILLRSWLAELIQQCKDEGYLDIEDPTRTSELIFVISDGAYYYLSMVDDDYESKIKLYKEEAFNVLGIEMPEPGGI
ncbi:MAG: TetR family transcriptional regulator [Cyclobacteriaceae bacterium]